MVAEETIGFYPKNNNQTTTTLVELSVGVCRGTCVGGSRGVHPVQRRASEGKTSSRIAVLKNFFCLLQYILIVTFGKTTLNAP